MRHEISGGETSENVARYARHDPQATTLHTHRYVSALYGRQDALYSLALLLYQNAEQAEDELVATLAWASTAMAGGPADPALERRLLVSRLLAAHRRDVAGHPGGRDRRAVPRDATGDRSAQEDALLGIVLCGDRTYRQAAASVTGMSAASAARVLRSLLRRADRSGDDRPARPGHSATREGGR